MNDLGIALLATAGLAGVYFMSNSKTQTAEQGPYEKLEVERLYGELVAEGTTPERAEKVIEYLVTVRTETDRKYWKAMLKGNIDTFLGRHGEYTGLQAWQGLHSESEQRAIFDGLSISDIRNLTADGAFSDYGYSVMLFPHSAPIRALYVNRIGDDFGFLTPVDDWVILLHTIAQITMRRALYSSEMRGRDLVGGLKPLLEAFYKQKIMLNLSALASYDMSYEFDDPSDPQLWVIKNSKTIAFYNPDYDAIVTSVEDKYWIAKHITTEQMEELFDHFLDFTTAADGGVAVSDAHAYLSDEGRRIWRKSVFEDISKFREQAVELGITVPIPQDLDDFREYIQAHGETYDSIEKLNLELADIRTAEEAEHIVWDNDFGGEVHESIRAFLSLQGLITPPAGRADT